MKEFTQKNLNNIKYIILIPLDLENVTCFIEDYMFTDDEGEVLLFDNIDDAKLFKETEKLNDNFIISPIKINIENDF